MRMLVRKFYCPACGERLIKSPKTRIIRRADRDYRKYRRIGHTRMIGDVKLTEYDFKCPCCGKITSYEDQCVIETIQKNIGKQILSEAEIAEHTQKAKADLKKRERITKIIVVTFFVALTIFIIYLSLRHGIFSVKFYL